MASFLYVAALIILSVSLSHAQRVDFFENFENQPELRWNQKVILGDAKLDTFQYSTKRYFPIAPIDNSSAFFDVYNGGLRGESNGNGKVEKTELISPYMTSTFSSPVFLSFDYQFIKLRSARLSALITADSGKTWKRIWSDSIGNSQSQNITLQIDKLIKPNGAIKLKFEWATSDTFLNQGYGFFDNVLLYSKQNNDVGISSSTKTIKGCVGNSIELKYQVKNWGNLVQASVIVETKLIRELSSITLQKDTFWGLKPNQIQTISIRNYTLTKPGKERIIAFVTASDAIHFNDTSTVFINISDSIKTPNSANEVRCGSGSLTFKGTSDNQDSILWLSKEGVVLGSGDRWTTPEISQTDTFMLHSSSYDSDTINTFQGPYRFNTATTGGSYLQLAAKKRLVINGYAQHFASDQEQVDAYVYIHQGSLAGHEQDSTGWKLWHKSTITTKGWGNFSSVNIPALYLNAGDTISMYIAFVGKAAFTFKKGDLTVVSEALNLMASSVNDKLFSSGGMLYKSYSWDGKIMFDQICLSPAKTVYAIISPKPQDASINPSSRFSGIARKGDFQEPDDIGIQYPAIYQILPPNGKKSSEFGSAWNIENLVVESLSGNVISKGLTIKVDFDNINPPEVIVSVDSLWTDSLFTISMKLKDSGLNCDTVLKRFFRFSKTAGAAFSFDAVCLATPTLFTNKTQRIKEATFLWDFDDGTTDSATNPIHAFQKNRVYRIQLISFNKFGVPDTSYQSITALLFPKSSIRAIHSCLGIPAELQNTSANASLTNSYYTWIYNGDTIHRSSDTKPFTYVFNSSGIHSVTLVSNHFGCIDSIKKNVFQFENPKGAFDFEGNCQFGEFKIMNKSTIGSGDKLGFRWLLDDVNFSTVENPNGIFSHSGTQKITLKVTSEFNCSDTVVKEINVLPGILAKFSVGLACKNDSTVFSDLTLNPSKIPTNYYWNLGDGTINTTHEPRHYYDEVGEKKVQLIVLADNGCKSSFDTTVVVRVHPDAHFKVADVCAGEEAIFLNQSKLENKILYYRWYFGDGDSSVLHSPTHEYNVDEDATYLVRLKVFTKDGLCTDEFTNTINVHQNPNCAFRYELLTNDSLTVQFFPLDSSLNVFTWTFDGGGNSTASNPTHTFQEKKIYNVRLFAKNDVGCNCDNLQEVKVGYVSNHPLAPHNVKIYPNPFFESIYLENTANPIKTVSAYNLIGQKLPIYVISSNSTFIEVKFISPPPEFVVLSIQTENGIINKMISHR